MFIQATTPRPVFDSVKHPKYIWIHTLAKVGTSGGEVFFNATKDPEQGTFQGRQLDPTNVYDVPGEDGFETCEYIVPFWELFQQKDSAKKLTYDGMPVEGQAGVRVASMELVRYCTNGFRITIKSAFRQSPREYGEHIIGLHVVCPATGGGVIRIADSILDLNNASFDPFAPNPQPVKNLEFEQMYARNHKLITSSIEDRRAARIAAAERSMRNEQNRGHELPSGEHLALPLGVTRKVD